MHDDMIPTQALTPEQLFFFKNAAYSYDPMTETHAQGRTRCAIEAAASEALYLRAHQLAGVECVWEPEDDPDDSWMTRTERRKPHECEQACIMAGERDVLACLGNIFDADDNYRRCVRAELAHECADALRKIIATHED